MPAVGRPWPSDDDDDDGDANGDGGECVILNFNWFSGGDQECLLIADPHPFDC